MVKKLIVNNNYFDIGVNADSVTGLSNVVLSNEYNSIVVGDNIGLSQDAAYEIYNDLNSKITNLASEDRGNRYTVINNTSYWSNPSLDFYSVRTYFPKFYNGEEIEYYSSVRFSIWPNSYPIVFENNIEAPNFNIQVNGYNANAQDDYNRYRNSFIYPSKFPNSLNNLYFYAVTFNENNSIIFPTKINQLKFHSCYGSIDVGDLIIKTNVYNSSLSLKGNLFIINEDYTNLLANFHTSSLVANIYLINTSINLMDFVSNMRTYCNGYTTTLQSTIYLNENIYIGIYNRGESYILANIEIPYNYAYNNFYIDSFYNSGFRIMGWNGWNSLEEVPPNLQRIFYNGRVNKDLYAPPALRTINNCVFNAVHVYGKYISLNNARPNSGRIYFYNNSINLQDTITYFYQTSSPLSNLVFYVNSEISLYSFKVGTTSRSFSLESSYGTFYLQDYASSQYTYIYNTL